MRDDFENKKSSQGIHYTRYIASYRRSCDRMGCNYYEGQFENWLRSIGLNEDEINDITFIANNGRMELETDARIFLKVTKNTEES